MKYFWLVIQVRNHGKCAAHPYRVSDGQNLLALRTERFYEGEVIAANICESKKKAYETASALNRQFSESGVYLYNQ